MSKTALPGQVRVLIDRLGEMYASLGRPPLEGRFAGLMLVSDTPMSLTESAQRLGVTKPSLLVVATAMLERGDVKREEALPSRRHLYSLTDHAYIRDLHDQATTSRAIAAACQALMQSSDAPSGEAAKQLRNHARVNLEAAHAIEAVLRPEEAAQNLDLRHHLEHNPDALPARRGRGRKPPQG